MTEIKSFETERLILKPMEKEDALFLLELHQTPKWLKYIGDRNLRTVRDAEIYIEQKITPQFERLSFGNYTVIRKSDGKKMGSCGMYDREGLEGIDIGFAFMPQYEKKGYAFESASKLMEVAVSEFNLKEINAITVKENISSQKLLNKIGLTFNKTTSLPGDEEELLLYSLKTN